MLWSCVYIYIYIELQGRLVPKVLDSDRGAVIKFFKQRNYCFPKQIVSGRSLLQWGKKKALARNNLFGKTVVSLFKELYIYIYIYMYIYSTSSKLLVTLRNARRLYLHANIKLRNCTVIITRRREHLMSLFSSKPFLCFGVFSEILRTFWPKIQHHEEALSHP